MVLEEPAPPFASRVFVSVTSETEDLQAGFDDSISRLDDRYWAFYTVQRFTWQRFGNWWAVRRWVQPRDVRKR